jgi:hypothetical protein
MRAIKFSGSVALAALIFGFAVAAPGETATNNYNFAGPEIYPIDVQIGLLRAADLNGDGLNDLIVVNNLRTKINLLYNQTGKTNPPVKPERKLGINDLPPDARFRIDSVPTDERMAALAVADLNGDGRADLVFYGDARELEIIYNQGTNGWSDPKRWHIEDGRMDPNSLIVGDLNGDGLPDIVLLGDSGSLYFLPQQAGHTFGEPQKIFCSGTPEAVQLADVNGDGRMDLLLVDFDSATPFRFRLQNAAGQLGPEIYFKTQPIHAYCADTLEGNSNLFVMTIAQNSDRAEVSEFTRQPAEVLSGPLRQGQFQVLPLRQTSAARRGLLWADVDGDGRPDLIVAEPESGQISVHLQQPDGSLAPARTFPTLAGVGQVAVADWNGDGHPEIFLLSQNERAVGATQFDQEGRLPFPTLLPVDGKPLVMAAGPLKPGAKPALCMIVDKDGQRYLVTRSADGKARTQKLSEKFKDNPVTMAIQDVNQDGLPDLVVLIPYDKVKVLLQKPDGGFDEEDVDPPGGPMAQPWLATVDADGDGKSELLLPQNNFVRAVVLEKETGELASTNRPQWTFRVKDQINGAASDSQIAGATTVAGGTNAAPSIFLLDSQYNQLTLCQRDSSGVWRVVRNIKLPVAGFNALQSVALGGTNVQSVAFFGQNGAAWMPLAGDVWEFTTLDGYDTSIKDGYINDMMAGDLTGTGRKDVVFLETAKNNLDIVSFNSHHKLVPAIHWQVFEAHTFRGIANALPEPREALVSDMTGDGKNDLILLVHDRILVYPQQ